MMGLGSNPISERFIARQTSAPKNPPDGMLWINPAGGANGNNTERYTWNNDAGTWELTNAVGPDTPDYPATGALWRDTANSQQKVYDGTTWVNVGVNDLTNLNDVTGVTSLTEDTQANRPAAGTEGRIYIESDTGRVLYDDGASWVGVGETDHANLSNVTPDQHHASPTVAASGTVTISAGGEATALASSDGVPRSIAMAPISGKGQMRNSIRPGGPHWNIENAGSNSGDVSYEVTEI